MTLHNMPNTSKQIKTTLNYKYVALLASISGLRMFGFFMLLPIFTEIARYFKGSNPQTIGLAMGIYGLVQAILYLPLGALSDKFGRLNLVRFGLICLMLGSLLASYTDTIYGLIIARSLQGFGAISSVLSAWMADIVDKEHRTKAMAIIGATIGLSFPLSLVLSPILLNYLHIQGLFLCLAALSALALVLAHYLPNQQHYQTYHWEDFKQAFTLAFNPPLIKWMLSVCFLHALSMLFFFAIPTLISNIGFNIQKQWQFYLPVLAISFIVSMALIRRFNHRQVQISSYILFIIAYLLLMVDITHVLPALHLSTTIQIILACTLYFVAFNNLEILQPSIISQLAPPHLKGSVMGIYYSIQAFGMFIGAVCAGQSSLLFTYLNKQAFVQNTVFKLQSYLIFLNTNQAIIFSMSLLFIILWIVIDLYLHIFKRKQSYVGE